MNQKNKLILGCYSLVLIAGGIVGYLKSNSLTSLLMSFGFGICLLACVAFSHKMKKAISYSAFLLVLLDSFFSYRFLKTWKIMPAGIFAVLTFIALIAFIKVSDPIQKKARREP